MVELERNDPVGFILKDWNDRIKGMDCSVLNEVEDKEEEDEESSSS
jgi:hypothetical protein